MGETGLAMVHKGETILPSANDTLKRAIELNTAATLRAAEACRTPGRSGWSRWAGTRHWCLSLPARLRWSRLGSVSGGWTVASASVGAAGASGGGVAPSLDPGSMGAVGTPGGEAGAIASVSGGGTSGYGGSATAARLLAPLPA